MGIGKEVMNNDIEVNTGTQKIFSFLYCLECSGIEIQYALQLAILS